MDKYSYAKRQYEIVPYDPDWPQEFKAAATVLWRIFGSDATDIQHIGSTSIPGMDGKPVIDILILVDDVGSADIHRAEMATAGYDYAGAFVMPGAILFRKMKDDTLLSNVHVFQRSHHHVEEMLELRDYLRAHPKEVTDYSELKRNLYKRYANDYDRYREEKDDYMERLKSRIHTS
ncbi:MAG: GrpB family protein [bacterium]